MIDNQALRFRFWFFVFVFIFILHSVGCLAQQKDIDIPKYPAFYCQHKEYLDHTTIGMYTFTSWGVLSLAGSLTMLSTPIGASDDQSAFWQMNAAWGGVNALISGFGIYKTAKLTRTLEKESGLVLSDSVRASALREAFREHKRAYSIALIIDVLSLGIGAGMASYGSVDKGEHKVQNQIGQGGYAIIYQSIGLTVFDCLMYQYTTGEQNKLKPYFSPAPSGIGMVYHF